MIIGGEFGDWLEDRPARAETMARIKQRAGEFESWQDWARLESQLPAAQAGGAEAVLALARRFIRSNTFVDEALARLISAASSDPFYRPHLGLALSPVHCGLLLFDRPALTILAAALDADAIAAKRANRKGGASIVFTGERALFHFVDGGGATLSFWEAPPIEHGFTAAGSGRCRLVERRPIADGETLEVDGRYRTFVVDSAPRNLVYLQASTPLAAAPLRVEYDSATHAFVGASSTDETSSRTQMMLALLRILDRQDAVPVFRELLDAEHFYARWQTMRELLALDAEAALPHLREMAAADPHPDVREAAGQTLARFFPEAFPADRRADPCPA